MATLFNKAKQYFGMTALQQAASEEIEYLLYEKIAEDIEQGFRNKGVWTKAFVEAEGNEDKTKAKYIALMVLQLQLQIKAGLELQEIFNEIGGQEEPVKTEPVLEDEPPPEEIIEDGKGSTFEEVKLELQKLKEKAYRDMDIKFAEVRKDLSLKKETKPKFK
jgi:hypothetical protein